MRGNTEVYIDSASIYELISLFRYPTFQDAYPWAQSSAIEVTSLMISNKSLLMSPSPSQAGIATGDYGLLMYNLSQWIKHKSPNHLIASHAIQKTKRWTRDNSDLITSSIKEMRKDETNFITWLEQSIIYAWGEHSQRLGGLFNFEFIPQISKILDLQTNDLKEVWSLSKSKKIIDDFIKRMPDDDNFKIMQDAYIASALIRGRYHEYVAKESQIQILPHKLRKPVFINLGKNKKHKFRVLNTQRLCAWLIVESAFCEKSIEERINLFTENLDKIRKANFQDLIDLRDKPDDITAIKVVKNAAKMSGVRIHKKKIEKIIDLVMAIGIGYLTSFILTEWVGIPVNVLENELLENSTWGNKIARNLFDNESNINKLPLFKPGRIESNWNEIQNE